MQEYTTFIHFKPGSDYAQRERDLQSQINQLKLKLESTQNIKCYDCKINTRSDSKASVSFFYQKLHG